MPWNPRDGRRGAQNPRGIVAAARDLVDAGMTLDGVDAGPDLPQRRGATRRRRVLRARVASCAAARPGLCALVALANRLFPADDETEATTQRTPRGLSRAHPRRTAVLRLLRRERAYTGPEQAHRTAAVLRRRRLRELPEEQWRARAARRRRQFLTERRAPSSSRSPNSPRAIVVTAFVLGRVASSRRIASSPRALLGRYDSSDAQHRERATDSNEPPPRGSKFHTSCGAASASPGGRASVDRRRRAPDLTVPQSLVEDRLGATRTMVTNSPPRAVDP